LIRKGRDLCRTPGTSKRSLVETDANESRPDSKIPRCLSVASVTMTAGLGRTPQPRVLLPTFPSSAPIPSSLCALVQSCVNAFLGSRLVRKNADSLNWSAILYANICTQWSHLQVSRSWSADNRCTLIFHPLLMLNWCNFLRAIPSLSWYPGPKDYQP
jgi:hypothetical protein